MPDDIAPPDRLAPVAEHAPSLAPFRLPAHEPLHLDDPTAAWIVASGIVTLFATRPPRPPATEGARRYLGTVSAGGLICGVGTDDLGATLLAVGGVGTLLMPLDLGKPHLPPGETRAMPRAVADWSRALAAGLARSVTPRPRADLALTPGAAPLRPANEVTIAARGGPVWARITGGSYLFLGLEPVSGLIPLPAEGWLTGSGGTVEPLPRAEAIADPAWRDGLATFNRACLDALPVALALDAADELNRLRLRAERDAEAGAEGRAAFAEILGNAVEREKLGEGDPLMPVFRVVAEHLGIRARRPVRVRRADMDAASTLDELARASGLVLRPVRLEEGWWRDDLGPLFTTRANGETVGLLRDGRGYRLIAPERPAGVRLDAAAARGLSRDARAPIVPLPPGKLKFLDLLAAGMRRGTGDIGAVFATLLLGAMLGQAVPIGTGIAFSLLIPGGHLSELTQLGVALILVAAVAWAVRLGGEIARARIEARAGPALHAAIWDRVLRLPLATLNRQTVGETAARAAATISLAAGMRGFGFTAVAAVSTILSALVVMLLSQPVAAAVAIGVLSLQLVAANLAGWLQARAFASGEALSGLADATVFQIVSGLTKLRLAGAESRAVAVWADRFAGMRRRLAAARRVGNAYDAFAAGFVVLSTAGAFFVIALMSRVEPGEAPPPLSAVMTFIAAYGLMMASGMQLSKAAFGLWFLIPSVRFAQPLLDAAPETHTGRVDPGRLTGALEVSNVFFRYGPTEVPVFRGLDLKVEAGEFVAITGRSGSGKSTLVRLILGMDEPAGGAIYADGQDIRGLDLGALRQQVATVLQAGRVPPGSIREAVRGLTDSTDKEVWDALDRAALGADVRAMPMALETNLTDAARVLSGGQAQRLLLARALVQKPAIIILDEATSALDAVTQAATMRAVRAMPCTRIVIAHRLSTIREADRIIVLDGGKVAESGTFETLMKKRGGLFAAGFAKEAGPAPR